MSPDRSPGGKLKLSREQRKRLFAGDPIPITGDGKCPYEPGDYPLSSRVTLRVVGHVRTKKGGWVLKYELVDTRDTPRLLRRVPSISSGDFDALRDSFDEHGYPQAPTPDVLSGAAEESAYTSAPTPLSDAGEAVDARAQRELTEEARERDDLRELRRREAWEQRSLSDRLKDLEDVPELRGHMEAIRRRIQAAERRKGKAA